MIRTAGGLVEHDACPSPCEKCSTPTQVLRSSIAVSSVTCCHSQFPLSFDLAPTFVGCKLQSDLVSHWPGSRGSALRPSRTGMPAACSSLKAPTEGGAQPQCRGIQWIKGSKGRSTMRVSHCPELRRCRQVHQVAPGGRCLGYRVLRLGCAACTCRLLHRFSHGSWPLWDLASLSDHH